MVSCRRCGGSYGPEELVRHEHERMLVVHCPNCGCTLGRYRRHGEHAPRS